MWWQRSHEVPYFHFIFSRASDKIWGRFDKDELVLKVVKENRENNVREKSSEEKKIVASQPEEERRKIVKAALKELCVELLQEEKRRLKKKTASVSPPPQVRSLLRFYYDCFNTSDNVYEAR